MIEDAVQAHACLGYEQCPQNGPCELLPVCSYETKNNKPPFSPNFDKISKNVIHQAQTSLPGGSSIQTSMSLFSGEY